MTRARADGDAVAAAYRSCEALTRTQAANFYYGIRLLPADKRRAMCAVYAFARRVDDIGDGNAPAGRKRELLDAARIELAAPTGPPMRLALADAEARFALPRDALEALIDGVEMDIDGRRYDTFDEVVDYSRHVAGTIGRLCLAIFGSSDVTAADPLADDLGVALQLTNILRDVREDLQRGRVYLPHEDLVRFGCEDLTRVDPDRFAALVAFEVQRAREWFERGLGLRAHLDARSAACLSAMTGIYHRILERIDADPGAVLRERVSLPVWEKTWVALRSLAGATP